MQGMRHALTGALYEVTEEGLIRVTYDGETGEFRKDGTWVRGDLRIADPQLCGWLGGPQLPSRYEKLVTTDAEGNLA